MDGNPIFTLCYYRVISFTQMKLNLKRKFKKISSRGKELNQEVELSMFRSVINQNTSITSIMQDCFTDFLAGNSGGK